MIKLKELYWRINNIILKQPLTCRISRSAEIKNSKLEGNNKVTVNAKIINSEIGYGTFVAKNSIVWQCKIGRYCAVGFETLRGGHPIHTIGSIHPALYSSAGQYGFTYAKDSIYEEFKYIEEDGEKWSVVIGNDVWVTAGATKIYQNIRIGDGAVIMADAVVTKDVPPYAIVGGVPAKIIGYRFNEKQIEGLLKLQWWNRGEEWIKEHVQYFDDVDHLLNIAKKEGLV